MTAMARFAKRGISRLVPRSFRLLTATILIGLGSAAHGQYQGRVEKGETPPGDRFNVNPGQTRPYVSPDGRWFDRCSYERDNPGPDTRRYGPPDHVPIRDITSPDARRKYVRCAVDPCAPNTTAQCWRRPGTLQPYLEALDRALGAIPGLAQALQSGAQITRAQARALEDEWTKSNDSGIKMALGALLDEYTGRAFSSAREGIVAQVARATNDDAIIKRFSKLLDPTRLQALKGPRGANPSFNKIMYWVHVSEQKGLDTTSLLNEALHQHGVPQQGIDLIVHNLKDSYQLGQTLEAFTAANLTKLRTGGSAKMGPLMNNTGVLDIGHIIDVDAVPDLGRTIANLKWEWSGVNRAYKNQTTPQALQWARKMYDAGLITAAELSKILK
jgi:hypothetical protein